LPTLLCAQRTLEPPVLGNSFSENLSLQKVELSPEKTILHLELICLDGDKLQIPPFGEGQTWHLLTDKGEQLPLKALGEAEVGGLTCGEVPLRYFSMIFEALPEGTDAFDLKESKKVWFGNVLTDGLGEVEEKAKKGSPIHQKVMGLYHERMYEYEPARSYYEQYVNSLAEEGDTTTTAYFSGVNLLARLQLNQADFEAAQTMAETVLSRTEVDSLAAEALLLTLGDTYQLLGKHDSAIHTYRKYIELKREAKLLERTDLFKVHNMISYSYGALSELPPPINLGALWLSSPQEEGEMKIFVVGASKMRFVSGEEASEWEALPRQGYLNRTKKEDVTLFVEFKDGQDRISERVPCLNPFDEE
ncbi:MAG: hypothetical protein AAF740_10875, partial [Bacteroidota bacterium]